ncbi:hypothetical protein [Romboutsia sp.]|uniref:hypothetical protein n=1 Tax=Romboutsia sp. TaxID=1965302 RepID=UPI002CC54222|nr:hypothetical protein [Romboutsia sp.]HSQ88729.1 hypothetical protein [Romboutsia sp.]
MEELKWLESELVRVYMEYAEEAKRIWTENDAVVADEKVQKLYRKYKSKQIYLDRLIQMQKSVIDDVEIYKEKYS